MKILLDTSSYFPIVGGVQLVVHHLAEALSLSGHDVTVSGFFSHDREKLIRHYKFENKITFRGRKYVKHLKIYKQYQQYVIFKILKKVRPDIIHCHYLYPTAYEMLQILKKYNLNIPVVATAHGVDIQKVPEINYGLRLDTEIENKIKWVINNSTRLIAISNDIYKNYIELGADEKKIERIPNPIAYHDFAKSTKITKKEMGFDENLPLILSIGRNHPKKGHHRLLKILKILETKNINVQTIILGKNAKELQPLIDELKIENPVFLIESAIPAGMKYQNSVGTSIKKYFDVSDIFAMTSTVEGFGLVTAEAMASGIPVVGFNAAGTHGIIENNETGFLITGDELEFADKIIYFLQNEKIRKKMGSAAKDLAQKYACKNIACQHLELYKKAHKQT